MALSAVCLSVHFLLCLCRQLEQNPPSVLLIEWPVVPVSPWEGEDSGHERASVVAGVVADFKCLLVMCRRKGFFFLRP